jgi:hypothetical protein
MKKIALTFACAVALVTIAPVPATANLHAAPVAAARIAVASTASLTMPAAADAMSQVHGAGLWGWIKNTVKKVSKWIWDNHTAIVTFLEAIFSNHTTAGTNGVVEGDNRTDYISANEDVSETYDTNGNLISTTSSSSEAVDYTEYTPSGN